MKWLSASQPSPNLPSSIQPPKGGAFILDLVLQAAAFTAAQAVGAVEDTTCLPTPDAIGTQAANNPQQSWGFEWEPPEAVIKDSGTRAGTSRGCKLQLQLIQPLVRDLLVLDVRADHLLIPSDS
jgi:hypothetical protein